MYHSHRIGNYSNNIKRQYTLERALSYLHVIHKEEDCVAMQSND